MWWISDIINQYNKRLFSCFISLVLVRFNIHIINYTFEKFNIYIMKIPQWNNDCIQNPLEFPIAPLYFFPPPFPNHLPSSLCHLSAFCHYRFRLQFLEFYIDWNHILYILFCLTYFSQHSYFEIHNFKSCINSLLFFLLSNTTFYRSTVNCLSI